MRYFNAAFIFLQPAARIYLFTPQHVYGNMPENGRKTGSGLNWLNVVGLC